MVDIHCHCIYGIDDGAQTIEESIQIIKEVELAGFTNIVLTPHYYIEAGYVASKEDIKNRIDKINELLKENRINVKLHIGNEVYMTQEVIDKIKEKEVSTLAESKYILIEFPMHTKVKYAEAAVFRLQELGLKVIIAHPERYSYVQRDIETVENWIDKGCLLQCNYGSIIGQYGKKAKKTIKKLLKKDQVYMLASDCHMPETIYPKIPKVLKKLKKIISNEKIEEITKLNALNIIKDR